MAEDALPLPARLAILGGILIVLVAIPLYLSGTFDRTVEVTLEELKAMRADASGTKFGVTAVVRDKSKLSMGLTRDQAYEVDGSFYQALRLRDGEARLTIWFDPEEVVPAPTGGEQVHVVGRVRKVPVVDAMDPSTTYIPKEYKVVLVAEEVNRL